MATTQAIPAAQLRGQLQALINFSGTHKEHADRYRVLLEGVLSHSETAELVDTLKMFIEASK